MAAAHHVAVKRVSVLDLSSFACECDYVLQWSGDRSVEAVSTLVRSFFQFASEIDEGEVSKVKFSSATEPKPSRHNRSRSRTGPVLSGVRKAHNQEDIYLQCRRGSSALVAVFAKYAPSEETSSAVDRFLASVDAAHKSAGGNAASLERMVCALITEHFGVSEEEVFT